MRRRGEQGAVRGGPRGWLTAGAAVAGASVAAGALAVAAPGPAQRPAAGVAQAEGPVARVQFLTANQREALRTSRVRVRVQVRRAATVRLETRVVSPGGRRLRRRVVLRARSGETGRGTATVRSPRTLTVRARGLRPTRASERDAYEVWLYNSRRDLRSLGAQVTDAQGNLTGAAPLPSDARRYRYLDLSRERIDDKTRHSGRSVLRGSLLTSGAVALTRDRTLRFSRRGSRTVVLRLTGAGRRALARCGSRRVSVTARAVRGQGSVRGSRRAAQAGLQAPCAETSGEAPRPGTPGPGSGSQAPAPGPGGDSATGNTANADRCDFLDPAHCLFPWPNDHFTRADATTDTGRRVNLNRLSMPKNVAGVPIDSADYNRNDGFSPGQKIVTKVPGLDTAEAFQRTGAVPITDVARSYAPDQPVVVINTRTGERHLIFSELDANPRNRRDVNLLIRPAVNFDENTRYIVALRNLRDADGRIIPAGPGFRVYRDRIATAKPEIESRRAHFEGLFTSLGQAGIAREDLFLAWDFTVGSRRSLTERMLHIRDEAFKELGDESLADLQVQGRSPTFTVTEQRDFRPCGGDGCQDGEDDRIARRVEGRVMVPCFLDQPGCPPGSRFLLDSRGLPTRLPGNVHPANFICNIPRSAVDGETIRPARPTLNGHGLLGSATQVSGSNKKSLANEHNFMICASDWIGMSMQDIPNVGTILVDFSRAPTLFDRVQQGMLNFLILGRAMIHPQGFGAHPAFRFTKGPETGSVIDTSRLYYDGGSQGGIIGGSLTAVAPDFTRAALGVPGMNYSTLLRRSIDFDEYGQVLYANYPDELERPLLLSMAQMLWDRSEANGYAHHMTSDPLPNTPPHQVLLQEAFGDHQVANVTTEVMARTIGARIRRPALDPGRHTDVDPYFGIAPITGFPFGGSALVVYDVGPLRMEGGKVKGTPPPPANNTPPREGIDPHGPDASETVYGRRQVAEFLKQDGGVTEVCGERPCYLDGWTGPPELR